MHVVLAHVVPFVFRAQPIVSVSVDVVAPHVPLLHAKSVRPRVREPEFVHALE